MEVVSSLFRTRLTETERAELARLLRLLLEGLSPPGC
jgi:hypothetical protein